jgi:hypothetical protein
MRKSESRIEKLKIGGRKLENGMKTKWVVLFSAFRIPPSTFRLPPSAFRIPPSAFNED